MINIERIDHLVLTVSDIATTCAFYQRVLGMHVVTFGDNRQALAFGQQKINLHQVDHTFEPKAAQPTPGSADVCLITQTALPAVIAHLQSCGVTIIAGPVERDGALGALTSVYIRDPDLNLIELSVYT
jgi:catechol 2,3-dioxygenase-like lactoylglutathione lyase family enzyme